MVIKKKAIHTDVISSLKSKNYRAIKSLESRSFGYVMSGRSDTSSKVAVKVIAGYSEKLWPLLNHENILPILDVFTIINLQLKLFVMPLHPAALDEIVHSSQFFADPNGFKRAKKWFMDILVAVKYYTTWNYDIKTDNVLISKGR